MESVDTVLLIVTICAGLYMSWNIGANDVANAIGTSVGSGALRLRHAVIIAAIFEFCGAFFFGSHVSDMIQDGIVNPSVFAGDPMIFVLGMLSALIASGLWLQIASFFGWPVSTTHSIIGAVVGFGAIVGGVSSVNWSNVLFISSAWVFSPLIGGLISYLIFSMLRKRIFFALCPVTAAKKLTPFIIFAFVTTLGIIILNGLKDVKYHFSFFESVLTSIGLGIVAALIGAVLVRRVITPSGELTEAPDYSPEAITALHKAKKHLSRLKKHTQGESSYKVREMLYGVDSLMKESEKREMIGSADYASVERIFGYLQMMSACTMAFAHGANDVANAIGPLSAAVSVLLSGSLLSTAAPIPMWTLALGGFGIILGLATWGWRVIETIGKKITELTPSRGFSAEFGATLTIVFASRLGLPVSTTHILVGSVLGVGMARGIEALNLNTTRDIAISWVVTVPAGAAISICCFYLLSHIFI